VASTRTAGPPGGRTRPRSAPWPSWTARGKPRSSDNTVRSVGLALTLLAVVVLGFVGYLYFLSGVQ
jgi:hypothetical protein